MNRRAFLLGLYATGGQILLLRELVSSLHGDEIFIGTALFGWLIWGALGAYLGGRFRRLISPTTLFAFGSLMLPVMIVLTRLLPLAMADQVGEVLPLVAASVMSIFIMLPVGVISGGLFSTISRSRGTVEETTVHVYLFEGLGAFAGGVAVLLTVGETVSGLALSIMLGIIVVGLELLALAGRAAAKLSLALVGVATGAASVLWIAPATDQSIDAFKYSPFRVISSFDTRYSHQVVLSHQGSTVLITDNQVEATYPDVQRAENCLLPPIMHRPEIGDCLFVGRPDFGIGQLSDSLPDLNLTALDHRGSLVDALSDLLPQATGCSLITEDPVRYFSKSAIGGGFDLVILPLGNLDSYRGSRMVTAAFFDRVSEHLSVDGMLFLVTSYDTDRYVTDEARALLSVIYRTLRTSFEHVTLWPGEMTLFFAAETPLPVLSPDSLAVRLGHLPYRAQLISEEYLADRLNELKRMRLSAALDSLGATNSLIRPVVPHLQIGYHAKKNDLDRRLIDSVLQSRFWVWAITGIIVIFILLSQLNRNRRRAHGRFLFFVAGLASLSAELTAFYLYQSQAGSLYSAMAVLIGSFMLGLASGTWTAYRCPGYRVELVSLATMLAAVLVLMGTFQFVSAGLLLPYYSLFLFVVSLATGGLFVVATRRYYGSHGTANRGAGYGWELVGASLGALFTTTLLLPTIGLYFSGLSLAAMVLLAIIGSLMTS
ncbi:MAG: hypothetical protein JSU65_01975 [Candidatus Zixiibacteriota bacterium]|nr:MAG: hypothetical protein JSU65_01975 [candidate division Zixibacteria bacterium]